MLAQPALLLGKERNFKDISSKNPPQLLFLEAACLLSYSTNPEVIITSIIICREKSFDKTTSYLSSILGQQKR